MGDKIIITSNNDMPQKRTVNADMNYNFDFLVLSRNKDKETLKEKIESRYPQLKVISIIEENLADKDDKDTGYKQADFSILVDLKDNNGTTSMATLYYYTDRTGNIVIIETAFDLG